MFIDAQYQKINHRNYSTQKELVMRELNRFRFRSVKVLIDTDSKTFVRVSIHSIRSRYQHTNMT
jgi:hypothetical protein